MGNSVSGGQYSSVRSQSPIELKNRSSDDEQIKQQAAADVFKHNIAKLSNLIKDTTTTKQPPDDSKMAANSDQLWNSIAQFAVDRSLNRNSAEQQNWAWDRTVLEDLVLDIGKSQEDFVELAASIRKWKKGHAVDGLGDEVKEQYLDPSRVLPDSIIVKLLELDEDLAELRFKIVPRQVSEENYWIIYSNKVLDVAVGHIKACTAAKPAE